MPPPKKISAEKPSLRITVIDPPPSIEWALQLGEEEILKPTIITKTRVCFDFSVDVVEDSSSAGYRLRGPAVQGCPGSRFVYLRMGAYAGQVGALAGWRAKIGLEGITRALSAEVRTRRSVFLEAWFVGTGRNGSPACATVQLLGKGWQMA